MKLNLPLYFYHIIVYTNILIISVFWPAAAFAQSSETYQLQNYGFGSGGEKDLTSENYKAAGISGEEGGQQLTSESFKANTGLTFAIVASVPPAPTFTNPGTNYDRLHFVLATGDNATDAEYAISISNDDFVSDIRYVQSDNTVGTSLGNEDWQTYTNWGGGTGEYVTNLTSNITYKIRVKARQGDYSESPWGPASSGVATSQPTLTFSVSAHTVTFNNLNPANSYTDDTKSTVLTTSTNAYNGYIVNARSTGVLTSPSTGTTIADYASPNSNPTTWSGTGFGYTTDDASLTGGTANRFSGPKYAGFTTASPGDPVADHPGPITTAISNETFTISYKVSASDTTRAGRYETEVLYMAIPEY